MFSKTSARLTILTTLLAVILPVLLGLSPAQQSGQTPAPQESFVPGPLFKQVVANQESCEKLLDEYQRVVRSEVRKVGTDPNSVETKVWLAFPIGTGNYKIPLPDGKSPSPDTYRSDLEKLEKYLSWLIQDGSAQKEAYAKADRKKKERTELLQATYQAFLFAKDGSEMRGGRNLLRYTITPNPNYKPTTRNAILFTRVRGTIWVDEQSSQLAKIEGSVTEDISLALFLAKISKGSHFMQERYEVTPGVWEPTFEQYDFDGRKFFSSFSIHERTFYSEYKRVGRPKEALEVVRAQLSKTGPEASNR